MDIVSHAISGAAMGAAFGRPLEGALFAILPDMVLPIKRIYKPIARYNLSHSLLTILPLGAALWAFTGSPVALIALLSHVALDIPTHGPKFAPTLFYPVSEKRFSYGSDWEFFSPSWWAGLTLTILWSIAWLYSAL